MKKTLSVLAVIIFAFAFCQRNTQINISTNRNQIEKVYPKGFEAFKQNLTGNLQYTANNYQVLGDFKLSFTIDKKGEISDINILPAVDDLSFARAIKRDVLRMQKKFASGNKERILVDLSFSRDYKSIDDRVNFTSDDRRN